MTKNLIWLASYPKSGNTWTRAFIGSVLGFGTINESGSFSNFTSSCASAAVRRQIYGEETPPPTDLTMAWRDPYQAKLSERIGKARHFSKTHSRYGSVSGNRLINPDVSLWAVVIVRNPFDVAASMANYLTTTLENGIKVIANPVLTLNNLNRIQHTISAGSWDINIISWLTQRDIPVLLMRYEDMYFTPAETFGNLARTILGIENPERIARAVAEADFAKLKEKENTVGFQENISKVNSFFWKGYPYHALDILDQQQTEEIWQRHRLVAEALGYRFDGTAISLEAPRPESLFPLAERLRDFIHAP
jgi:hypothetical protein